MGSVVEFVVVVVVVEVKVSVSKGCTEKFNVTSHV